MQYTTQVWHLQCIYSRHMMIMFHLCVWPCVALAFTTTSVQWNSALMLSLRAVLQTKGSLLQVVCPPAPLPKKSDPMDKFGMDPHDAKGFDSGSTFGKGGEMQKGDSKKDIPAPPPCYTVQASPFQALQETI